MRIINEQKPKMVYLQDSTAASISTGSYSSAIENNLSSIMRNGILLLDPVQGTRPQADEYAVITKIERDRIKKAYPKPSLAKPPAIGEDLDIV